MQSTQTQIFYGVTAISCAFLLYSIAKKKSANKCKNKKKSKKTPQDAFRTKQWFISYFHRSKSSSATQNLRDQTKHQRSDLQVKKRNFEIQNMKQQPSNNKEKSYNIQSNDYNDILNQRNNDEDELFFKLEFRLLNSVKG